VTSTRQPGAPGSRGVLAHGLAFWATRFRPVPGFGAADAGAALSAGRFDPATELDAMPRIAQQAGTVADRFSQLEAIADWSRIVAAPHPSTGPEHTRAALTDLVTAATLRYLYHGHASPVLLVHTATAPNAVLHSLPALPDELWAPSLSAVWAATAAIYAAYAPAAGAPREILPATPDGPDAAADVVGRAVAHGDEHVIKFTDTAVEVYTRTGHPDALAAASHIATLISN
jgi:hypothetical protein